MLVALLVMLRHLGTAPVWIDEGWTLAFARLSWPGFFEAVRHGDANDALYYCIVRIVGAGDPTLLGSRLISVVCAVATLIFVFAIGLKLFDRRIALMASALCAANFLFLVEAREARVYALLCLVTTASWFVLLAILERPTFGRHAGYCALLTVSFYLHPLALFDVAGQLFAIALMKRSIRPVLLVVVAIAVAVAATMPLVLLERHEGTSQLLWYTERPGLGGIWYAISAGSGRHIPSVVGSFFITAAACFAVYQRRRAAIVLVAWLALPPLFGLVTSWILHPVFLPRYYVEIVPAAALLIAWLVFSIPLTYGCIVGIVLLVSTAVGVREALASTRLDWPSIDADLKAQAVPGDVIAFYPGALHFAYREEWRLGLNRARNLPIIYPPSSLPVWYGLTNDSTAPIAPGHRTIWVVYLNGFEKLGRPLDAHYRPQQRTVASGLILDRYVPR